MSTVTRIDNFPELLRRLRVERGLDQQALAERMTEISGQSWHDSTVSRWESGQRGPSPEALAVLADALGLAPETRFGLFAAALRWEMAPTAAQIERVWQAVRDEIGATE